ncbi:MAG: PAS domain S-box protein [Myxococcales bacterium]|nr:PAS domain S-box protein [Myxococcales bacterium]
MKMVSHRHRILIVDDEDNILQMMERILVAAGYEFFGAKDSAQALVLAREKNPCMIMVDVMMPETDGYQTVRSLRKLPGLQSKPIALMSGKLEGLDPKIVLDCGADDFLHKPFDKTDLLQRVAVHMRLFERETRLRAVSEAAQDAIIVIDDCGDVVHWNPAAERTLGYSGSEVLGKNIHHLIAPERFHSAHFKAFEVFASEGTGGAVGKTIELPARHKDGHEIICELSLSAAKLNDRWHAIGIVRDVTEKKRIEAALRESEERHRVFYDQSQDAIMTLAPPSWRFTSCNPATLKFFNVKTAEEFTRLGPWDVSPEKQPDGTLSAVKAPQMIERAMREGRSFFEWTHQTIDGRPLQCTVLLSRIEHKGEHVLLATVRDISEQKRAEAELGHARKLEAVGRLAAGIAHEINTPTQFVSDSVQFIKGAFEDGLQLIRTYQQELKPLRERDAALDGRLNEAEEASDFEFVREEGPKAFARTEDGLNRIATIVRAMKEFSHPATKEKTPADLNRAIQTTLTIARNEYKYVAEVETDLGELPPVPCLLGDLNQVFLNLIVNAAHAIGDKVKGTDQKGKITIRTRREGDQALIAISDTGSGIPQSIRHRIFEPFFTTKDVGKGTGQGLAIARSVVIDKHGGRLDFESEEGVGTTFFIRLPLENAHGK